jgi:DNA repair exonuclease SbcCD ATPase subunit
MNIIPFVYIFSLYVLFTPGVLFKRKSSFEFINALLFSIIWYFTFGFVEQNQEYMSPNVEVDVDGLKDLVNSLNDEIHEKVINVDVKNEYITNPATDNSGIVEICEEKIQEIADYKKQIEDLNAKLAHYDGTLELIASLESTIKQLEEKQEDLMNEIDMANQTIANQKSTIQGKDDQIGVLDGTIQHQDGTIQSQAETIDINKQNIINLRGNVKSKNQQINNLNSTLDSTVKTYKNQIQQKINEINRLAGIIRTRDTTIRNKNNVIRNKDNECANHIRYRDNIIKNKDNDIRDRDNVIKNKDNEWMKHIRYRDNIINSCRSFTVDSYKYLGEGGCDNNSQWWKRAANLNRVRNLCKNNSRCRFAGQQSNGCWHLLEINNRGNKKRADYPLQWMQVR